MQILSMVHLTCEVNFLTYRSKWSSRITLVSFLHNGSAENHMWSIFDLLLTNLMNPVLHRLFNILDFLFRIWNSQFYQSHFSLNSLRSVHHETHLLRVWDSCSLSGWTPRAAWPLETWLQVWLASAGNCLRSSSCKIRQLYSLIDEFWDFYW